MARRKKPRTNDGRHIFWRNGCAHADMPSFKPSEPGAWESCRTGTPRSPNSRATTCS